MNTIYYYTSVTVKIFLHDVQKKIVIFSHFLYTKSIPPKKVFDYAVFPVRNFSSALCRHFWFPVIWLVEGIFSVCNAWYKFHYNNTSHYKYQYNYDKTLVQSIGISMIKHLFIGWKWNNHPQQKLLPSGKPWGNSSCLGLNKRAIPLITIK